MLGSIALGYLLGNFQTAYLIGKFFGKMDIRQEGSSNAGASNVTQVMGWRFGFVTALVDILKAFIAGLWHFEIIKPPQQLEKAYFFSLFSSN